MNIREKILVVEDEKSISHFISAVLNTNGYEAMQARSGQEALSMISSHCPDLIILDPPRDGVHPKALPKILSYGVEQILYISCKPTSLARDLEIFEARGYKMVKACCVDMFPGTVHVETVALLTHQNID